MVRGQVRSTGSRPWPAAALRASACSILFALGGFAVLAWFLTVRQARRGSMGMEALLHLAEGRRRRVAEWSLSHQRAVKASKAVNRNGHPLRSGLPVEAIEDADARCNSALPTSTGPARARIMDGLGGMTLWRGVQH